MNKIKVEDMACFEQVAKVIGVTNARRELFIALNKYNFNILPFHPEGTLGTAFDWYYTKQGDTFWLDISCGINPYNQ